MSWRENESSGVLFEGGENGRQGCRVGAGDVVEDGVVR